MRIRASIVGIACLVAGCAGTGEFSEPASVERRVAAEADDNEAAPKAPARRVGQSDDELFEAPTNLLTRNYNITVVVADPLKAIDAARAMVIDVGAEVVNADRQPQYASLNVVVHRNDSERLFLALRSIGKVTNETQGQNDMRAAMHELRGKLNKLELADMTVQQAIRDTNEHDVVDALVTLLELSRRERESSWQQIRSYQQQGRGDQIYINFQLDSPVDALPSGEDFGLRPHK